MINSKTFVEDEIEAKVQTGIRMNQQIAKAFKMLAQENNISIGELFEKLIVDNYCRRVSFTDDDILFLERYLNNIIKDTVIVSAETNTFNNDYMSQKYWWSCIDIATWRLPHLKYFAVYQKDPISTIGYYSEIDKILPNPGTRKYDIYLKGPRYQVSITPKPNLFRVQGRVYTELQKIIAATDMTQVK